MNEDFPDLFRRERKQESINSSGKLRGLDDKGVERPLWHALLPDAAAGAVPLSEIAKAKEELDYLFGQNRAGVLALHGKPLSTAREELTALMTETWGRRGMDPLET